MQKAYKLLGKHRHYDWGGTKFIPNLMQVENKENLPYAEYWMGAHSSAPSQIETSNGIENVDEFIQKNSLIILGKKTNSTFGTLPYLFKILDVSKMLSIQVHPTKANAILGFDKENAQGIALDAPHRNYKDQNHKPEVMVALSDFWLLHGFLPPEQLTTALKEYACFRELIPFFKANDYKGLYHYFMNLTTIQSDLILRPLLTEAVKLVNDKLVSKAHPHWWASKYYNGIVPDHTIDKGIFSLYILNIVFVSRYQGVFQEAGLLHAYLEGQNIELMANSDNVLRGGLTPKHIDVDELIQHVNFSPTYPFIMNGVILNDHETNYPCPIQDFCLSKISIKTGETYSIIAKSLQILLVMEGMVQIDQKTFKAGEVAMITADQSIDIEAMENAVIFKSYVP